MKMRRAGCGSSSGLLEEVASPIATSSRGTSRALATLGDDPVIAAALRYAGEDLRAWWQTDAAWRAVWGVEP